MDGLFRIYMGTFNFLRWYGTDTSPQITEVEDISRESGEVLFVACLY